LALPFTRKLRQITESQKALARLAHCTLYGGVLARKSENAWDWRPEGRLEWVGLFLADVAV